MVTLTLGKTWEKKVEEIANLKAAKHELKDELREAQQKLSIFESEILENRSAKDSAEKNFFEIKEEYQSCLAICLSQEQLIQTLQNTIKEHEKTIETFKTNTSSLQCMLDNLQSSLQLNLKLVEDLKCEIKHGNTVRNKLEAERDGLRADYDKKCSDFEVLTKAKEHSERHIAILLKEKDRLLNKNDSKPLMTSKIYEVPLAEEKVTS